MRCSCSKLFAQKHECPTPSSVFVVSCSSYMSSDTVIVISIVRTSAVCLSLQLHAIYNNVYMLNSRASAVAPGFLVRLYIFALHVWWCFSTRTDMPSIRSARGASPDGTNRRDSRRHREAAHTKSRLRDAGQTPFVRRRKDKPQRGASKSSSASSEAKRKCSRESQTPTSPSNSPEPARRRDSQEPKKRRSKEGVSPPRRGAEESPPRTESPRRELTLS